MSNFFRSLFGAKKAAKIVQVAKSRMQTRRLELIGLEERITPAVVSNATGIVTITLGVGESITNLNASYNSSNQLVINTVGVSNTGTVTGVTYSNSSTGTNDIITVDDATFVGTILGLAVAGNSGTESVTVGGAINLLANAPTATNSLSIGTTLETLNVNAAITTIGTTPVNGGATLAATAVTIGAAGDIVTTGNVSITGVISTAGNVNTTSGAIGYTGAVTLTGAVALTTTTNGTITLGTVAGAFGLTTSSGAGNVSVGAITGLGAVSITSTGTIGLTGAVSAASVTTVSASGGTVTLGGAVSTTNDISIAGAVTSTPAISVTSSAGSVAFGSSVASTGSSVTISAATPGKSISLKGAVTAAFDSNILLTGDVLSNDATAVVLSANGAGSGNITITGKVDAATAGNDLTITAGTGIVTLTGNVGSGLIAFGDLNVNGSGIFLASGTVVANNINIGQTTAFATSTTFAKAVTANVLSITDTGINVNAASAGTITFSDAVTVALGSGATATVATSVGQVDITSLSGAIKVVGNITGLDLVAIDSTSGAITLSGAVTTSGTNTAGDDGDITIGSGTSGNVLLSGNISTTGTGDIELDNDGTGTLTINGNVSTAATSATNGDILIGADNTGAATGAGTVVTINGTVTTTGTTAGDIYIAVNGASVAVNKAVTAGATGDVVFVNTVATDVFTIASGATISAGDDVFDDFVTAAGIINLGANITALNDTGATIFPGIFLDNSINLTGSVSMKAAGTLGQIGLASVNGAQNLTLEAATGNIILSSVGQTTALKTVTVTNSAGVSAGAFSAANVVLTDTTGTIAFGGSTVITSGLTTAAKAYDVTFAGTTVLSGAPVFLNTGNVTFGSSVTDITSLTTGATITGTAATTVNLAGTIVSGGAFNIGALPLTTTIADGTGLILNSTSAASTFAGKVVLLVGDELDLLGVGTLTLSGDSSTTGVAGNILVINGTLNVTGKIGAGSLSTATSGTISGAGGTIGVLNVNTGTVAPGGTLNTAAVTLNAATNYSAAVLTTATASNLKTAAAINLGGATLSLSSVVAGLAVNSSFFIINNTALSGGLTGTFANQAEGSSISAKDTAGNTVAFTVSYKGGDGNDVTLKVTSITPSTPAPTAKAQPMVAGQPALNKFTAIGADAGGAPQVTITFQNGTFVSFLAYASTFTGGVRVALGDVDGNGSTDLITGAGPGGGPQVNVYNVNNATGEHTLQQSLFAFTPASTKPTFTGGVYVAAGDTNADGFDDVIIGAGKTGGSRVQVYAGSATGVVTTSTLNDFFAYSPAFTGGVVVAAGDRNADGDDEIITAPASSGGYNIKSFDGNGKGNTPTLVDNFFAFNNTTSVGGLSLAVGILNSGGIADLIVGTSNGGYGVILDSVTSGITGTPFAGFTGAIRAGVAEDANGQDFAVALAGPTGGPRVSVFSVGATSLSETDNLFVMNTSFKGGLFGTPTLAETPT